MSAVQSEPQLAQNLRVSQAIESLSRIVEPPPNRNAGQWADAVRILPPESPEPGPWRTDRVPFWRDIYAAFSDDYTETIVVACGAQMSKTEGIFNVVGHRFTDGPYVPALYIGPTEKQVKTISRDRIDKMLRSVPELWQRTAKGQKYSTAEKTIGGVTLGFRWAGSATELASSPAGLIMLDELDRMPRDVGGEGSPFSLARARAKNYRNRKIGVFSTPTLEGESPIWGLLESGTLSFWAWPCQSCYVYFVPQLSLLQWPKGCTPDEALTAARIVCPRCGHEHDDRDKQLCNHFGRYTRHRRLNETERVDCPVLEHYTADENPRPMKTASFWVSGLASPWATPGEVAKVLIEAYRDGDTEKIQAEVNTWGGELFRIKGDAPEWDEVAGCRAEYNEGDLPAGVQLITLGADVQKFGIFYVVRAWGYMSESWLLEHGYLAGETEHNDVWNRLREIIAAPIRERRIDRAFIDSGYRPGDVYSRPDHAVYTFCRSLPGVAFPTKGADTLDGPFRFRNIDYSSGGAIIKNGVRLFHVNTDYFKKWIHARVRWPDDTPGGWHLHAGATEDYCRQIVAEELVIKASGRPVWIRKNKNNHYLDCEVNATCAGYTLNAHKLAEPAPPDGPEKERQNSQPAPTSGYDRRQLF
jgi:phage terminase large subunit GpA-like protein